MLLQNWNLQVESENPYLEREVCVQAHVPGDITSDLYQAGLIENPYYGLNHKELLWISRQDFTYKTVFDTDSELLQQENVLLNFESIDLFADIYLNGKLLGRTQNMFLKYTFEVKGLLREKDNVLQVKLHSTLEAMDRLDDMGYFGTFNTPRIFLRTVQCHFGWDWAPNLPGYGICGEVSLEGVSATRIEDVTYRAGADGRITFIAEVNYNIEPTMDDYGVPIADTSIPKNEDKLEFYLETKPESGKFVGKTIEVDGIRNFVNFTLEDVELWWPNGYGKQSLYNYRVVLYRGGRAVSEKKGRCAFREVKLVQEVKDEQLTGFEFYINGVKVFAKGSNWIPADCFTGCVTKERYGELLRLAKDGNMNMLRVWGGGLYEHDAFYDFCDEMGIMIFQDFMFACSDLPEDNPGWQENALADCEYQIKRLRNHPCIVYWSGGNEKTGSCLRQIPRGDFFIDYLLMGLIRRMDPTRPFGRQSPCSLTEVGNDLRSGDCHYGSLGATMESWEKIGKTTITDYRKLVARQVIGFLSEVNGLSPDSLQTMQKSYPADKLWPINEYWVERMTNNPYDGRGGVPFATWLERYVADLYGRAGSVESFIAKGMMFYAETIRTEIEWARAHQPVTGGILNWMYNDIWPCGTWSVIDYYTEPKQVYYQMKRSFRPVLASFVENKEGQTELVVINESGQTAALTVEYGCRTLDGKVRADSSRQIVLQHGMAYRETVDFAVNEKNTYLYTSVDDGEHTVRNVYSPNFWRDAEFHGSYAVHAELVEPCRAYITVRASGFVKGLFLSFPDNFRYHYSDNYLDIEDGQEVTVEVTSVSPIDIKQLMVIDYAHAVKGE